VRGEQRPRLGLALLERPPCPELVEQDRVDGDAGENRDDGGQEHTSPLGGPALLRRHEGLELLEDLFLAPVEREDAPVDARRPFQIVPGALGRRDVPELRDRFGREPGLEIERGELVPRLQVVRDEGDRPGQDADGLPGLPDLGQDRRHLARLREDLARIGDLGLAVLEQDLEAALAAVEVRREDVADVRVGLDRLRNGAVLEAALAIELVMAGRLLELAQVLERPGQTEMELRVQIAVVEDALQELHDGPVVPVPRGVRGEGAKVLRGDRLERLLVEEQGQQLADLELVHVRALDDLEHVRVAVHALEDLLREGGLEDLVGEVGALAGEAEDLPRRRHAGADVLPLVDAARRLHDQGVDVERQLRDRPLQVVEDLGGVPLDELELRVLPDEEVVDLLLDLDAQRVLDVRPVDDAHLLEDLAEEAVARGLLLQGPLELVRRDAVVAEEDAPQAVLADLAAGQHGDAVAGEVDGLPRRPVRDDERALLLVDGEHLEDVREVDAAQIPLQAHLASLPLIRTKTMLRPSGRRRR
jgi:hypothetical protein